MWLCEEPLHYVNADKSYRTNVSHWSNEERGFPLLNCQGKLGAWSWNKEYSYPTGSPGRRDLIQRLLQHSIGHISSTCIIATEELEHSPTHLLTPMSAASTSVAVPRGLVRELLAHY